jgi:hypothetical protein
MFLWRQGRTTRSRSGDVSAREAAIRAPDEPIARRRAIHPNLGLTVTVVGGPAQECQRRHPKRRLTVPAALAPASPGDYFDAHLDAEEDTLVFRRLAGREDWLAVLKACPVSPDDVPPRRRPPARCRKL